MRWWRRRNGFSGCSPKSAGRSSPAPSPEASIPALLSATQGNSYKLRVYPILPQRDKVVVLRYAETLAVGGGKHLYRLPLHYGEKLPELATELRAAVRAGEDITANLADLRRRFVPTP